MNMTTQLHKELSLLRQDLVMLLSEQSAHLTKDLSQQSERFNKDLSLASGKLMEEVFKLRESISTVDQKRSDRETTLAWRVTFAVSHILIFSLSCTDNVLVQSLFVLLDFIPYHDGHCQTAEGEVGSVGAFHKEKKLDLIRHLEDYDKQPVSPDDQYYHSGCNAILAATIEEGDG
jgi:hypothetical protein